MMNHEIPLETAIEMTTLYRAEKEAILDPSFRNQDILANCETFDANAIRKVLDQTGCASMRIYYGMDKESKVHAIIVGVNEANEDMLPGTNILGEDDDVILDDSIRCPTNCPPPSPLNG
jgi:hypothetical protein